MQTLLKGHPALCLSLLDCLNCHSDISLYHFMAATDNELVKMGILTIQSVSLNNGEDRPNCIIEKIAVIVTGNAVNLKN